MAEGHKSQIFVAESEKELEDWLNTLNNALTRKNSDSRKSSAFPSTPPPTPKCSTLRSLEHSKNPELMKYARETDFSIGQARKEMRVNVFAVYHDLMSRKGAFTALKVDTADVPPYEEHFGSRFVFTCEKLEFNLKTCHDEMNIPAQVEPYVTSVAVFDGRRGKISEEFRFDVNDAKARSLLPWTRLDSQATNFDYEEGWLSTARSAIFSVDNPHSEMFLVLRVEKVLQGSISSVVEPYVRAKDELTENSIKAGAKIHKQVKVASGRLSPYRMPLAWSVRPLFRSGTTELDTTSEFAPIYKQDANRLSDGDIARFLAEWRKPDKLKSATVIPGHIGVKIVPYTSPLPFCSLTPHLVPTFACPPTLEPAVEVARFFTTEASLSCAFTAFVNLLYVFPRSLRFDGQKAFAKARNIACSVEFRDNDDGEAVAPLPLLFGRPNEPMFVPRAACAVLHHHSSPDFYEEVKLALPLEITEKHHLLFSFHHVSCDTKRKENPVATPIGFTWLPIDAVSKLNYGETTLPVSSNLPPGYLSCKQLGLGKGVSRESGGCR